MIIDCIADLHGHYPKLEGGDLLIVPGDLTASDKQNQYFKFEEWLEAQDYTKKVVIAGNHDNWLIENGPHMFDGSDYLCDSGTEFEGLKIWGSPWTKTFAGMNPHCKAFTCDTEDKLGEKWALIPGDTDILITHSPPYGVLDETSKGHSVGSRTLLIAVAGIKPILHCFGHIHERGGTDMFFSWGMGTKFVNCSHVNACYKPVNKHVRIIL